MPSYKAVLIILLSIFLLTVVAIPVFAVDYNVGVSEGQYVKYGNFAGVGTELEFFNDYDWQTTQVTGVSGKEITLRSTGQYKNGEALPGNGSIDTWNIETGTLNGSPRVQGPIIAADLNEGDPIPPSNTYAVNKTETRTYLGTARSVNILEVTIATPSYSTTLIYVYDKASGLLLEAQSVTEQTQNSEILQYSYSIVETNIFGISIPTVSPTSSAIFSPTPQQTASPTALATSTPTSSPQPSTDLTITYIAIIAMVITIIIVGVLILRRRVA